MLDGVHLDLDHLGLHVDAGDGADDHVAIRNQPRRSGAAVKRLVAIAATG